MTTPATKDALELQVADFGPIIGGKVELRPLTVFIGPSNTGKSYLAILIYALHRLFGRSSDIYGRHFLYPSRLFRKTYAADIPPATVAELIQVARSLSDNPRELDAHALGLPPRTADALKVMFDENAKFLGSEIVRCFGLDELSSLIRSGSAKRSRITMRKHADGNSAAIEHALALQSIAEFKSMVPENLLVQIERRSGNTADRFAARELFSLCEELLERTVVLTDQEIETSRRDFAASRLLSVLGNFALPSLVGPLHLPAYYLPADRTGVMHAHSVVVSALIAYAPAAGLRPATRTPTMSGVLADFLEQLIEVDQRRGPHSEVGPDLGRSLEDDILGGAIRIERSPHINYPRFAYRPHGWKKNLPLSHSSSMVSELAPVVLYLRHIIEPGTVLIIEEPESHLHPASQVAFTRQLAGLVKAGIRVIVTTHSEWLLEELANIVQQSRLPSSALSDRITLRPDQVGVWLFKPKRRPRGSTIREVTLDHTGSYPSGYDEVASALHNEWADTERRVEANS